MLFALAALALALAFAAAAAEASLSCLSPAAAAAAAAVAAEWPLRVSATSHVDAAEDELDVVGVAESSSSIEVGVEGEAARLVVVLLPLLSLPRKRCRIIWFCVIVFFSSVVWFKCGKRNGGRKKKEGREKTRGKEGREDEVREWES